MAHSTEPQPFGKHPDRAVSTQEEDRYGFNTSLPSSPRYSGYRSGGEGSAVIGIEGA